MLDRDTETYLEMFSQRKFLACDFLMLFSGVEFLRGVEFFDRDELLQFIDMCKEEGKFPRIFQDIHLKSNGVFKYCEELDEGYSRLKLCGVLYTISPEEDSRIYICKNNNVLMNDLIESRLEYKDELIDFVREFNLYEKEKRTLKLV